MILFSIQLKYVLSSTLPALLPLYRNYPQASRDSAKSKLINYLTSIHTYRKKGAARITNSMRCDSTLQMSNSGNVEKHKAG